GHEPTIAAAAAALAGPDSDIPALKRVAHGLPTGTAAVLEYEGSWADIGPRSMTLTGVLSADVQY
ncbi:MAG: histidine phosphatase family protein, partial [Demequina sp.]